MQPTSFYFIRHGETAWNVENRITGQTDIPINERGISQAKTAVDRIKKLDIKSICASSLIRAQQTAEIINQDLQCPLTITDHFKELCWGEIEGTCRKSDGRLRKWERGLIAPKGAETFDGFINRVKLGLEKVFLESQPTLIVAHGNVYWAFRKIFNITENMRIPNCLPMYFQAPASENEAWKIAPLY